MSLDSTISNTTTSSHVSLPPNSTMDTPLPLQVMSFPNLTHARQTELIAWGTVTLSLSFLGAVNNLLVLLVTWPDAGSKFGLNLLIFHFVAVNLFMCLMGIPISVILILLKRDGYFIPPNICNFFQAVYGLGATLVNWSDSMLAVNRCLALFIPHHYRSLTNKAATLAVLIFMWAIGLAGMLPMSFGVGGQLLLSDLGQCGTFPAVGRLGMFLMSLVSYFPFSVTGTGALLILLKMSGMARHRVVSHVGASANNGGAGAVRGRKVILRHLKMAKILLLTFLWSAFCNMPWGVTVVVFPWLYRQNPVEILWLRTCFTCQYGFTPCILLLGNAEWRGKLMRIMKREIVSVRVVEPSNSQVADRAGDSQAVARARSISKTLPVPSTGKDRNSTDNPL
ncbi:hypothetical protein BV898_03409 [Hypsibius exemplaris]|uniref:G-protein coupled receptors family 1 profile domain-containing protein n=1 Tax=Hypsibius exemplaris TaxID=2072580 RepID=A0A1W0X5D7_HYPEX|nr:hypothetical protein BV898_03409 [Hypsibius exemplaris]